MIDFILNNKEWLFSGIGITLIGFFVWIYKRLNGNNSNNSNAESIGNNANLTVTNNIYNGSASNPSSPEQGRTKLELNKQNTFILFIDDEFFQIADILKRAGWKNTSLLKKVVQIDVPKIIQANVIFVDINGVAKELFNNQGIGLARAIKEKYPEKLVIIYSAESAWDIFDKDLDIVDGKLRKNAEPYEFIHYINNYVESYNKKS